MVAPPRTLSRMDPHATQKDVLQPFNQYGGAYSFGCSAESLQIPVPSLHGGEGSSPSHFVSSNNIVDSKSVFGAKPGNSGVEIGYQVDEFIHIWSEECFAQSHIYPHFTGRDMPIHFLLEQVERIILFLDQAVADFKQGLDSILTLLKHWNPLMSVIPCHLQPLQGSYTQLV